MHWFDTATELEMMWCSTCQVYSVIKTHETEEFCAGFVYMIDLSCGCIETYSTDTED